MVRRALLIVAFTISSTGGLCLARDASAEEVGPKLGRLLAEIKSGAPRKADAAAETFLRLGKQVRESGTRSEREELYEYEPFFELGTWLGRYVRESQSPVAEVRHRLLREMVEDIERTVPPGEVMDRKETFGEAWTCGNGPQHTLLRKLVSDHQDYVSQLLADPSFLAKSDLVPYIGQMSDPNIQDSLLRLMDGPSAYLRWTVAFKMYDAPRSLQMRVCGKGSFDEFACVRETAAQLAGDKFGAMAWPLLARLASDEVYGVQKMAASRLAKLNNGRSLSLAQGMMRSKRDQDREVACMMLEGSSEPRAIAILTKALEDKDPHTRCQALETLSYGDDRSWLPHYGPLFADPNAMVVISACHAAASVKDYKAIPRLVKLLSSPDEDVRDVAQRALKDLRESAGSGTNFEAGWQPELH